MRWFAVDVVLVAVFAVIGRMSHDEGVTMAGWWHTAWPFLAGTVLGWVVLELRHRPPEALLSGVVVWLTTVVGGMLLRRLSDQGTAWPFVVVAFFVVGAMVVGARALWSVVNARRAVTGNA